MKNRRGKTFLKLMLLIFVLPAGAITVSAQDYTHPRKMKLPASRFERPDPIALQTVLENGLTGYIVEDHSVPLVTFSAFVRAGKMSDKKQGAAEALGHAFREFGPTSSSQSEFKATLKNMVADFSVTVHDEWTEITLNVPHSDTWGAFWLFASLLKHPNISSESLQHVSAMANLSAAGVANATGESGPVLYEGSLGVAVDKFHQILFKGHSRGVAPTKSHAAGLTIKDVSRFHETHFIPSTTTIAISGDFNSADMKRSLTEHFGNWPKKKRPGKMKVAPLAASKPAGVHYFRSDKLQSWLVMGQELPEMSLKEMASLEVMNYILGGGHFSTRLFIETRDKYGLTNDASGFLEESWSGPGSYTFRTYSRPEVMPVLYKNIRGELEKIRKTAVSEEELFIAKNALVDGEYQGQFATGDATARTFALEWLRYGSHEATASYPARIRAVSIDDVKKAAKKYINLDRFHVVLVGPENNLQ